MFGTVLQFICENVILHTMILANFKSVAINQFSDINKK